MAIKHEWKTAAIIKETKDTITIVFDTGGVPFSYAPGQFINVTLYINNEPVTRSYSLSSSPDEDINPAITVKRVAGGVMSNFILEHSSQVDKWLVDGPYGQFTPSPSAYTSNHIVLLGGGSGITPLLSIGRSILKRSLHTSVTLLYSSRTPEEIIFRRAIEVFTEQFKDRLHTWHVLSQATDVIAGANATMIKGRLNKLVARKLIKQATGDPLNSVQYFICGPAALMKMHQEMLQAMQVPAGQIHMEWFAPDPADQPESLPQEPQEVLLHFYEQTNLLDVQAGQSILAAALEDKIPLPYSCKAGTCGICTAKLTSGKVKMINNYALSESDVHAGMVLLCQSYPLNSEVTIEMG
jgi:ring-1,2-phenylacetyl-CoA epoxidase subunit PaaE